jgi:hypothetical protein
MESIHADAVILNPTIDEVVFAEPGDLQILGARTLEGLNLTIDPARRQLVGSGPMPRRSQPDDRCAAVLWPRHVLARAPADLP